MINGRINQAVREEKKINELVEEKFEDFKRPVTAFVTFHN